MISRRRFLQTGAAAAVLGVAGRLRADGAPLPGLRDSAASVGLVYGSDSDSVFAEQPPAYSALFVQQCALYACIFSWSAAMPHPDSVPPRWEDPNIAFARAQGLPLTGGHLFWRESNPSWIETLSKKELLKAARQHVRFVAQRYGSICYSWNVLNEALTNEGLRRSIFLRALGADYFDILFREAQEAGPDITRVYNDYGMEMDSPTQQSKREALLRLLDRMAALGTPIDAVGIQSHLRLDGTPFSEEKFAAFLAEIASRGLKIMITELDVLDLNTPPDNASRDAAVADMYRRYLTAALAQPAVSTVITWGLSDRYTWLTADEGPSFVRADGLPSRPLPFDADLQPKPSFYALNSALLAAAPRSS